MRTVLVAIVLMCAACGGEPPVENGYPYEYHVDGAGPIYSEIPLDRWSLQYNVTFARKLIVQVGAVQPEELDSLFNDLPIYVHNEARWLNGKGEKVLGQYDWYEGVHLNRTTWPLLHEWLHHVEFSRPRNLGDLDNYDHVGWDKNDYFAVSKLFRDWCMDASILPPPGVSDDDVPPMLPEHMIDWPHN